MNSTRVRAKHSWLVLHLETAVAGGWAFLTFALLALILWNPVQAGGIAIKDDLFVGVWSPFGSRWEAEAPVCIWGDAAGESYRVIATGLSSDTDFELSSDSDERITYRVLWFPRAGRNRRDRLAPGVPSRSSIVADSSPECTGGANSSIRVTIPRRQINRAPPGIYDDTLLVILSPL